MVFEAVARTASRSLRRDRRSVDSSVDGGGTPRCAGVDVEGRWAAGGLEVASFEALVGREASAASRSLEWWAQNRIYRSTILSKYSVWTLGSSSLRMHISGVLRECASQTHFLSPFDTNPTFSRESATGRKRLMFSGVG